MHRAFFPFALVILTLSPTCPATPFVVRGEAIDVRVPTKWQSVYGLFGLPLVMLGPDLNGRRPLVSLTATGITATGFDGDYETGSRIYLRGKSGVATRA